MTARIGDLVQNQRILELIAAGQKRIQETQAAVASGKTTERFDAIADQAALLVSVRHAEAMVTTRITRNEELLGRLNLMESVVGRLSELAERARVLLVQRLNGSTGADLPLVQEVDAFVKEIEAQLNLRFSGLYLFAGSRADVAPVQMPDPPPTAADPSLYYRGDEVVLSAPVEPGVELAYGVTAAEEPFARLIGALGSARQAHLDNDENALGLALNELGRAIEQLADLRGRIGADAARLQRILDAQRGEQVYLREIISGIEDTDVPTALTRLARDQMVLEASFVTISRLSRLTLTEYLR